MTSFTRAVKGTAGACLATGTARASAVAPTPASPARLAASPPGWHALLTFTLNPIAPRRIAWDVFILLPILYNAIAVPLRCAVTTQLWPKGHTAIPVTDIASDVAYAVDVAVRFVTCYDRNFQLVTSRRAIALHYARRGLTVHVLSSLPLQLLVAVGISSPFLRLPRLLRLFDFYQIVYRLIALRGSSNFAAHKLLGLLVLFLLLCFYWACLCHAIDEREYASELEHASAPAVPCGGYRCTEDYTAGSSLDLLLHSIYVAVASLTGRSEREVPVTNLQLTLSLLAMFIGNVVIAYIIGSIGILISSLDAAAVDFRRKSYLTNNLLSTLQVPASTKQRVNHYLDCMWARGSAIDMHFVNDLHPVLRKEMMVTLCRSIISKVPLFAGFDFETTQALAEQITFAVFPSDEYIMRKGTIGAEMYFVMTGQVAIVLDESVGASTLLESGSSFGERALTGPFLRNASVKAKTYCMLMVLSHDTFERVSAVYPLLKERVHEQRALNEKENELTADMLRRVTIGSHRKSNPNTPHHSFSCGNDHADAARSGLGGGDGGQRRRLRRCSSERRVSGGSGALGNGAGSNSTQWPDIRRRRDRRSSMSSDGGSSDEGEGSRKGSFNNMKEALTASFEKKVPGSSRRTRRLSAIERLENGRAAITTAAATGAGAHGGQEAHAAASDAVESFTGRAKRSRSIMPTDGRPAEASFTAGPSVGGGSCRGGLKRAQSCGNCLRQLCAGSSTVGPEEASAVPLRARENPVSLRPRESRVASFALPVPTGLTGGGEEGEASDIPPSSPHHSPDTA